MLAQQTIQSNHGLLGRSHQSSRLANPVPFGQVPGNELVEKAGYGKGIWSSLGWLVLFSDHAIESG